jgi:DNA-binding PadR family transcriptional regulator
VSISRGNNSRISPEYVLLGFLYDHPSHGYELNKRLADELGYIWRVSQSQTYNILNRLEQQGYITSTEVGQEKLPPRQLLSLTDAGLQRFNTWLETPSRCSVHAIRVEFTTRLYFIHRYRPSQTEKTISIQFKQVLEGINNLRKARASLADDQVFIRLALDMRIRLLGSILAWLDECQQAISTTHSNGLDHE